MLGRAAERREIPSSSRHGERMGLELLTQADYVLNACGRPVPPKGYKFVDLPKIIPFFLNQPGITTPAVAASREFGDDSSVILVTAVTPGVAGNSIVIELDTGAPFPPNQAESVSVVGTTIKYIPATNAAHNVIYNPPSQGTNLQMLNALNGSPAASALATFSLHSGPITASGFGKIPSPGNLQGGANAIGTPAISTQNSVANNSNTLFLCKGIMLQTDPVQVRIKWPNGRYWNQFPSGNPYLSAGACFPQGTGGNLFAFDEEVAIEAGARVGIEVSGTQAGSVSVQLWGVLRYLLKDTAQGGAVSGKTCIVGYPAEAKSHGPPSCLIGYPVTAPGTSGLKMMQDPVQVLKMRPRFSCWPNGNIFAPEFRLGNQCETETPPGYEDESFTFFSGIPAGTPYVIPGGGQNYSNQVGVPGQDDIVIRRFRGITTWLNGAIGNPVVQLRTPSGYSLTGGDQIPFSLGYWIPVFPTLRLIAGTVLIIDLADSLLSDSGQINVVLEFDAVKRRKL